MAVPVRWVFPWITGVRATESFDDPRNRGERGGVEGVKETVEVIKVEPLKSSKFHSEVV